MRRRIPIAISHTKSQIHIGKDDFVIPFGKAMELVQYEGEMIITFPFAYFQGIGTRIFSGGIFSASITGVADGNRKPFHGNQGSVTGEPYELAVKNSISKPLNRSIFHDAYLIT